MDGHLLTPLALLALLVVLVPLERGSANQYEDYYMQDLLTREQQVHTLEKPVASTVDRQDPAKRRATKGGVDAKPGIAISSFVLLLCEQR